jgi:hypothetical protein
LLDNAQIGARGLIGHAPRLLPIPQRAQVYVEAFGKSNLAESEALAAATK